MISVESCIFGLQQEAVFASVAQLVERSAVECIFVVLSNNRMMQVRVLTEALFINRVEKTKEFIMIKQMYLSVVAGSNGWNLKFRNQIPPNEKRLHPTLTVVVDMDKNNIGFSCCSPNDNFSKKKGLVKAYGRLKSIENDMDCVEGPNSVCNHRFVGLVDDVSNFVNETFGI
jgi:hypothetical protein